MAGLFSRSLNRYSSTQWVNGTSHSQYSTLQEQLVNMGKKLKSLVLYYAPGWIPCSLEMVLECLFHLCVDAG